MNLAHFHTTKIIPIYSQGISNKFEIKICVTVLKHIMYEREQRRCQALVGGLVACSRENLKKIGAIKCILAHFHADYFLSRKHHLSTGSHKVSR